MKDYYVIDLEAKRPEVCLYTAEIVAVDMEYFGVKNALELDDPNWRVFETESAANAWLSHYNRILNKLPTLDICEKKGIPCLLYKRRFIVQSLMRVKTFTCRNYKKKIKIGELFNLHDQTYFLTVRLTKLSQTKDGAWRYDFELP